MPRDGSGNYTQPEPDVAPDTPIESAVYNNFVADVAIDLNTPRPVVAGGTGATNAVEAMQTLGGEIAEQLVTNYDSFAFQTGSFRSAGSATGGPVAGHAFIGLVYKSDDNNMALEARDQSDTVVPGRSYTREKKAGVWSAWVDELDAVADDAQADADAALAAANVALAAANAAQTTANSKVAKAGDTMSGPLNAPVKGHTMGAFGGTISWGALTRADASVMLYSVNAGNWAGFGADNNGNMWARVGLTGSPAAAWYIDSGSLVMTLIASPVAPTPPVSDDTTTLATTAFVNHAARLLNAQTGTAYTFVLSDAGSLVMFFNAAAITVTIPPNSAVPFPLGTQIDINQTGPGQVSIAPGAGVSIFSEDSKRKLNKAWSAGTLVKVAAPDSWQLIGSLAA